MATERFESEYAESLRLIRRFYSIAGSHWVRAFRWDDFRNRGVLDPKTYLTIWFGQDLRRKPTHIHKRFAFQGDHLMLRIHANVVRADTCETPLRRF